MGKRAIKKGGHTKKTDYFYVSLLSEVRDSYQLFLQVKE